MSSSSAPRSTRLRECYNKKTRKLNEAKQVIEAVADEIEINGPPVDAKEEADLAALVHEQRKIIEELQAGQLKLWNMYEAQLTTETNARPMPKPQLNRDNVIQLPDLMDDAPAQPPPLTKTDSVVQLEHGKTHARKEHAKLPDKEVPLRPATAKPKRRTYKRKRPFRESLSREKFDEADTTALPSFALRE